MSIARRTQEGDRLIP